MTNKPYSRTVYESSPLNRVIAEFGPGKEWHDNNKAVRIEYLTNSSSLTIPYFYCEASRTNITVRRQGNYSNNQLFITLTTDEEGNEFLEAKDKQGQVVCTRQKDGNTYYYTCYVYDDYGCLKAVLPPEAVSRFSSGSWSESNKNFTDYVFAYKYDGRNRCISEKVPGADWVHYIYDKADRLIFSQDGEQRLNGIWHFTIPDAFGRTVLTGTCKNSLSNTTGISTVVKATRDNASTTYKGYTISGVSLSTPSVLTADYYDNYDFMGHNGFPASTDTHFRYGRVTGYDTQYTASHKGLLTGKLTAVLDGSPNYTYLPEVMYYDSRGRLIQTKSSNHLGGVDKEFVAYNFNDLPVSRRLDSSTTGGVPEVYHYVYDSNLRLIRHTHSINDVDQAVWVNNTYDGLGRLKTSLPRAVQLLGPSGFEKENAPSVSLQYLQSTYHYNIRSWLTGIEGRHFAENLTYKYNGNIASQQWIQGGKNRVYIFSYDGLSQLTTAISASTIPGEFFNTSYSYDLNGNITQIRRSGLQAANTYGAIDILSLKYDGNQLFNVSDVVGIRNNSSSDFKNYSTDISQREYEFNKNGAMTKDLNKGITSITYNMLNLPAQIDINNPEVGGRYSYTYTARGEKLRADNGEGSRVDYVKNKIYEDGQLKKIRINDGYFDYEEGRYYIYTRDHLGNNRITARSGAEASQSIEYYPFGMAFADSHGVDIQPYKYSGKEWQSGIGLYDFHARQLDPILGRFLTIDPLARKYPWMSPYAYCGNNPINRIDPDGREWYRTNDGMYQFNPDLNKDNQAEILQKGQTYIGATHKDGTGTYRADGSIMFSNEKDAYSRMWNSSQSTKNEEMGVITDNGVLVLPNYKNTSGEVNLSNYEYSVKDGNVVDASETSYNTIATVHTHPSGSGPSLFIPGPGGGWGDLGFAANKTPNKPVFVLQNDGKNTISVIQSASANGKLTQGFNQYTNQNITSGMPSFNIKTIQTGGASLRQFTRQYSGYLRTFYGK